MEREVFLAKYIEKAITTLMLGNMVIESYTNIDETLEIEKLPERYQSVMQKYDEMQMKLRSGTVSVEFSDAYLESFLSLEDEHFTQEILSSLQELVNEYNGVDSSGNPKINVLDIYKNVSLNYKSKLEIFYNLMEKIREAETKNLI